MILNNIVFNGITFEVTRRCNMRCPHCLRGEAQNKDLDFKYIDIFLYRLRGRYIREVFFTGGEPSLNLDAIKYIIEKVKEYNIVVQCFDLVTNGKDLSDEFVDYVNSMDNFIVYVSIDDYHNNLNDKDITNLGRLSCLRTRDNDVTQERILDMGLARKNNLGVVSINKSSITFTYYKKNLIVVDMPVLTCDGDILMFCGYEYDSTDKTKLCDYNSDILGVYYKEASQGSIVNLQDIRRSTIIYNFFDWLKKQNLPL